jgi:protein-tyrosine phosphatase
MDRCSYFIPKRALFGSFPSQETVELLETEGVRYFVDLTFPDEKFIKKYNTRYNYIKYSIEDRSIPCDWGSFAQLVIRLCNIISKLDNNEKLYIHCKGGHGRSGVLVACILCYYYELSPYEALIQTGKCHSNRLQMREKWRRIGSPQCKRQKEFVHSFFKPLYFKKHFDIVNYTIFDSFEEKDEKVEVLYRILERKINNQELLQKNLFNTGLRPLIKLSSDNFWGNGLDGKGMNIYGKLLVRIRNQYFSNI